MIKNGSTGTLRREQWDSFKRSLHKKNPSEGKKKPSTALRRNGGTPVGYSGRIALWRE
jgi:hypothetical protein